MSPGKISNTGLAVIVILLFLLLPLAFLRLGTEKAKGHQKVPSPHASAAEVPDSPEPAESTDS